MDELSAFSTKRTQASILFSIQYFDSSSLLITNSKTQTPVRRAQESINKKNRMFPCCSAFYSQMNSDEK